MCYPGLSITMAIKHNQSVLMQKSMNEIKDKPLENVSVSLNGNLFNHSSSRTLLCHGIVVHITRHHEGVTQCAHIQCSLRSCDCLKL